MFGRILYWIRRARQIPGWDLLEVDGQLQLQKSWKAKNFTKGLEFIKSIADVAESEGIPDCVWSTSLASNSIMEMDLFYLK